eukprot:gene3024-13048_t
MSLMTVSSYFCSAVCIGSNRFNIDSNRFSIDSKRFSIDSNRFSFDSNRFSIDSKRFSIDFNRFSFDSNRFSIDSKRFSIHSNRFSFDSNRFSIDSKRFSIHSNRFGIDSNRFTSDSNRFCIDSPSHMKLQHAQLADIEQPAMFMKSHMKLQHAQLADIEQPAMFMKWARDAYGAAAAKWALLSPWALHTRVRSSIPLDMCVKCARSSATSSNALIIAYHPLLLIPGRIWGCGSQVGTLVTMGAPHQSQELYPFGRVAYGAAAAKWPLFLPWALHTRVRSSTLLDVCMKCIKVAYGAAAAKWPLFLPWALHTRVRSSTLLDVCMKCIEASAMSTYFHIIAYQPLFLIPGRVWGCSSQVATLLTMGAPHQSQELYPFGRVHEVAYGAAAAKWPLFLPWALHTRVRSSTLLDVAYGAAAAKWPLFLPWALHTRVRSSTLLDVCMKCIEASAMSTYFHIIAYQPLFLIPGRVWGCSSQVATLLTMGAPHQSQELYPFGRVLEVRQGERYDLPDDVQGSSIRFARYFNPPADLENSL